MQNWTEWLDGFIAGQLSGDDLPSVNALWLPAMALAEVDPGRCRALIDRVLPAGRHADGLMVSLATPGDGADDAGLAAWPLWACAVERVQQNFPDADWTRSVWPGLRKAFLKSLERFDPDHNGLPVWRSAAEAWDPHHYREHLATPALTVLLLREADALLRLRQTLSLSDPGRRLSEERDHLASGLLEFLGDPVRGCFDARWIGGSREPASPRMAVFPLLWPGLPGVWVGSLLRHAGPAIVALSQAAPDSATLTEIGCWRWTLQRLGARGLLADLEKVARRLAPPSNTDVSWADRMAIAAASRPLSSGGRILRIRLLSRLLVGVSDGRTSLAAACLLLAIGVGMFQREPVIDADSLALWPQEAQIANLQGDATVYADVEAAFRKGGVLPSFHDWFRLGRAEQTGDAETAVAIYERLRERDGDTAPIRFGLARAYQRAGHMIAARVQWQRFLDTDGVDFPVAARAAREIWWQGEQSASRTLPDLPDSKRLR